METKVLSLVITVISGLVISSCSINYLSKKGIYKELDAETFSKEIQKDSVNVIDVRTPGEFEKSHINGAWNVSYIGGSYSKKLDTLSLDPSLPTYIYCETQHRSLFAAKKLYKAGFKIIIDLDKGMMYYRKKGFPYYRSDSLN
ncbi:MAG: rhodanese-like domain-containing protein [Bacteroidetes bacterium]|nr:MAG: rhodanese-like domain-containing protein [Bacteroidota bacterium]